VPAVRLPERTGHQWSDERSGVDHAVVNLETVGAATILGSIELSDLRQQIPTQTSGSKNEQEQRQQERLVERHAEMPCRHQQRTERHRIASSEHSIANQPAEYGCEVHQPHVNAEDLRRESLR
jgi:hypothetical protein